MKKYKLIRASFPVELNVLIVLSVLLFTAFFSYQVFDITFHEREDRQAAYWGMLFIGLAVILVTLIVWEEILFPIKIRVLENGIKLSNNQQKLKVQVMLYLGIPVLFAIVYYRYHLHHIHFFTWLAICMGVPVLTKLFSGIKNYNDFLTLTDTEIEYKNNEKEGCFQLSTVSAMRIVKDKHEMLSKIILLMNDSKEVTIDIDEMELEAFYEVIIIFIYEHYKHLVK